MSKGVRLVGGRWYGTDIVNGKIGRVGTFWFFTVRTCSKFLQSISGMHQAPREL